MKWTSSLFFAFAASTGALAQDSNRDYLEHRNDLGIIAYCSSKGMLPDDSAHYFAIGIDTLFGKQSSTPKGDLHEKKGRDGIVHLDGDEQTLAELAADNNVPVSEVCDQYKLKIKLSRIIAKGKKPQ
ncbi:hypothetical protein [Methylorubrum salsuginis]|uniref:Uncharacterized protein n=1 Tax=Methylorubrum salsuginis TaxID=414703 RepID=A0A1I4AI00_9HYPH|nr:hypothetical protein [Methylorubrum salsuginis]SFK56004.1 hypothetical protein SAMN04488125_102405 [Methylorubrum salsuginis]